MLAKAENFSGMVVKIYRNQMQSRSTLMHLGRVDGASSPLERKCKSLKQKKRNEKMDVLRCEFIFYPLFGIGIVYLDGFLLDH